MHRRARHLNPKAAGASLVLDARFIAGNDGDAIGTWDDRSGNSNNATQGTAGKKPLLKTRANGQAGNNALYFDGSDDVMTGSTSPHTTNCSIFLAIKNDSVMTMQAAFHSGAASGLVFVAKDATNAGGNDDWIARGVAAGDCGAGTANARIICGVYAPSTLNCFKNGVLAASPSYTVISASGGYWVGDLDLIAYKYKNLIFEIVVVNTNVTNSIRRRIEQSLALTWKIACA